MSEYLRLYISPFSKELFPIILGSSVEFSDLCASFHRIETFPERSYGFVDLPVMEASRVKKKLNGTLLKGQKVKVEDARKDSRKDLYTNPDRDEVDNVESHRASKQEKKRNKGNELLPGYELPTTRRVRRGWTEPAGGVKEKSANNKVSSSKEKKARKRSQVSTHSDGPECLFQTKVQSTEHGLHHGENTTGKRDGNSKTVVHEFEKNVKHPSFVKDDSIPHNRKRTGEFDEEKGWVDEAGTLLEHSKKTRRVERSSRLRYPEMPSLRKGLHISHGSGQRKTKKGGKAKSKQPDAVAQPARRADKSGSDESETSPTTPQTPEGGTPPPASAPSDLPSLEVTQSSPTATAPHPLETLFKKPKPPTSDPNSSDKPNLEVKIPFNFFGEDETIEKSMETPGLPRVRKGRASALPNLSIPVTPYTQRDMQWRSQRSAAPTPDTAAPGKSGFGDMWSRLHDDREDDIEEEDEEENSGDDGPGEEVEEEGSREQGTADSHGSEGQKEFSKWFWEHRGENNRAWKRRRREAAKEQRQKENRRRKKA